MNIFLLSDSTDYDEHIALQAQYHCDRHVVKMIAESTQMLVTALNEELYWQQDLQQNFSLLPAPCKPLGGGHAKHPCVQWTEQLPKHKYYLARLAVELCNEHQLRYPLSPRHAYFDWLESLVEAFERWAEVNDTTYRLPTQFPVAISDRPELRSTATPHQEAVTHYRSYYFRTKRHFATWKKRGVPMWFLREQEEWQAKQQIAD